VATTVDNPWAEAAAIAELHACRTQDELERELENGLLQLLPGIDAALCLADDNDGSQKVAFTIGANCPLRSAERVSGSQWPLPPSQCLPIRYRSHVLGELRVGTALAPATRHLLAEVLVHYGTALVNLVLNSETRQSTDNYCASLSALEEGIVLFQEEDPAAVTARLLALASSMVQATAGALYVLREVGNPSSGLQLEQALGIPESLLHSFRGVDGHDWPDMLLRHQAQVAVRTETGALAGLVAECVPPILQQLVVLPLRYHGVEAGICLLFNPDADATQSRDHLSRLQSLGQLAAALLHRLRLEAQNANNHTIERELQIAETIQKRLLPSSAPATPAFDFAWSTIAAKNIGGDYLDLVRTEPGEICAVIADASGHGINSALLMSSFRSNYRGNAAFLEPNQLARKLNVEVANEVGPTGMFITAAMLRLDPVARALSLCSAGHCPLMIWRAATGRVEEVSTDGPPLGFLEDAEFTQFRSPVAPGDVLMLYTDGITEAANAELEMFGPERLAALLRQRSGSDAATILAAAKRSLVEFTGRERHDDDVSLLVIKVR
jgi:serine phosphatase RsbU (regulator of sigma subunit)